MFQRHIKIHFPVIDTSLLHLLSCLFILSHFLGVFEGGEVTLELQLQTRNRSSLISLFFFLIFKTGDNLLILRDKFIELK